MSDEAKPTVPSGPFVHQLAGMPEARQWASSLVVDVKLFRDGKLAWKCVDGGCVIHGPPGTGKTTLAKAIAASAGVPWIATSYAEWTRLGASAADIIRAMRQTFERAAQNAPCVVVIDELDSIPSRGNLEAHQVGTMTIVNSLLVLLEGANKKEGVVVIATCNDPARLDPALVRAGRLGRSIHIPLPNADALPHILGFHLGSEAALVDLNMVGVMCTGMSPAELEQLVSDARQVSRRSQEYLETRHFMLALSTRLKGLTGDDVCRLAVHEAGHAVVLKRLLPAVSVSVSLFGRGLGEQIASMDAAPRTRDGLLKVLSALLAGRAAEIAILGDPSSRCGGTETSDLALASRLAQLAVGTEGLSGCGSLVWWPDAARGKLSAALLDQAQALLKKAHHQAEEIVAHEKSYIEACAKGLCTTYAMTADALAALDPTTNAMGAVFAFPAKQASLMRAPAGPPPIPGRQR